MESDQERIDRLESEVDRLIKLQQDMQSAKPVKAVFNDVRITASDLAQANVDFGFYDERQPFQQYIVPPTNRWPTTFPGRGPEWREHIPAAVLHDLIKPLVLSVFGTRKVGDLYAFSDQEEAAQFYSEIRTLWLDAYRTRLERLAE
jgi:hypothetical protein